MGDSLLSIITPSFNRANLIGEAIQSVLDQDYKYVEHIIIDGCSSDNTLEVLARYPNLKVISEPDRGMYDAINKGIRFAKGEIIAVLNSDDFYKPNVFKSIMDALAQHDDAMALLGGARVFKQTESGRLETLVEYPPYSPEEALTMVTLGTPLFNGFFFRKRVFQELGEFALSYKFASDREFMIRFVLRGFPYLTFDSVVYSYRYHSESATFNERVSPDSSFNYEDRSIAESYLRSYDLPPDQLKYFRTWHSYLTVAQAINALGERMPVAFTQHVRRGVSFNFLWPVLFLKQFFPRFVSFIAKMFVYSVHP